MSHQRRKLWKTCETCFAAGVFLATTSSWAHAQSPNVPTPKVPPSFSVTGGNAGWRSTDGSPVNWDSAVNSDSGLPVFPVVQSSVQQSANSGSNVRGYRFESGMMPASGPASQANYPAMASPQLATETPSPISPFGIEVGPPGPIAGDTGLQMDCNSCPTDAIYLFHGYSSWRGISEGSGENNNGFLYGANYGTALGEFTEATGIEGQIGASYGLYDLNGRASGYADSSIQQQTFITLGLSRKSDASTNFSGGLVFDTMINDHFGQYASSPILGQLRAQLAYTLNTRHEIGFWTSLRMFGDNGNGPGAPQYRGVDQFNFFWHHKFEFGGDGWTWVGFPDHSKLGGNGTLGTYILGGTLTAPLSPRFGVYTDLQYMAPSAGTGFGAATEETFYIGLGVVFYPDRNSRTPTVVGERWMPYMPVANNGSFLVDVNKTF